MTMKVKELLETMNHRLAMQTDGIVTPSDEIKDFTKKLIAELLKLDESEEIELVEDETSQERYIRRSTGDVIASLNKTDVINHNKFENESERNLNYWRNFSRHPWSEALMTFFSIMGFFYIISKLHILGLEKMFGGFVGQCIIATLWTAFQYYNSVKLKKIEFNQVQKKGADKNGAS